MIYDLIGVGFGPSNLAVAAALHECKISKASNNEFKSIFLEKKAKFSWHEDMMLDGSYIQISFLKDIAVMRDPSSQFTFLNYLKDNNRLSKFINLRTFYPSRIEFNDYLTWVANKLNYIAKYNCRVISVRPIWEGGKVEMIEVSYVNDNNKIINLLTKNIIFSLGFVPCFPCSISEEVAERIFHTSQFLDKISKINKNHKYKFNVIGSGQSAVECALYLHKEFVNASINLCIRAHALRSIDDSHFVNEIFSPESRNEWFSANTNIRSQLSTEYRNSNFSAADQDLLDRFYTTMYEEQIVGISRLRVNTGLELSTVKTSPEGKVRCIFNSIYTNADELNDDCDFLICGTGYQPASVKDLLENFSGLIKTDTQNTPIITSKYKIEGEDNLKPKLFMLGCNELTHGISESLFSNMAVRSMEIMNELFGEEK